jgi:DNA-directed RNA polymerase subunit RPC12/RpoP
MQEESVDQLVHIGETRTDVHCHECSKQFVALIDYSIEGNHIAHCPVCNHKHYRVIKDGKITEERWNATYGPIENEDKIAIKARRVWKTEIVSAYTNSASDFIRNRWFERGTH